MTRSGLVTAPHTQTFRPASLVKMLVEENSEPVPAVVGMQILGIERCGSGRPSIAKSAGAPSVAATVAAILPTSMADPPPRQTTRPAPAARTNAVAASTCFCLGSPQMSAIHHDLGANPLESVDDRLGQPQLDQRAVGHQHGRSVGIAERGRSGADLAHPAAPEGDLWDSL